VNSKLVPSWKVAHAGQQIVTPRQTLMQSTAASDRRQQEKRPEVYSTPWKQSGHHGASPSISDRPPSLFQDEYDAQRDVACETYRKEKSMCITELPYVPAGQARASPVEDLVAEQREKGHAFKKSLEERYVQKRRSFQDIRDNANAGMSSFDVSRSRQKTVSLNVIPEKKVAEFEQQETEGICSSLGGLFALRK